MKMKKVILKALFFALLCHTTLACKPSPDKTESDNILLLYTGNYNEQTSYKILNMDKSVFAEIKSINGNEPSSPKLKGQILAYFEDYYIFHFKAKQDGDTKFFQVKVGNSVKLIEKTKSMEFLTQEEYILKFYCTASKENPLKTSPNINSKNVNMDYDNTSFVCVEIKGDWVKVQCNKECEGCPNNKKITGWIRWKSRDRIILKQHYAC
jgi:hypothetical protein